MCPALWSTFAPIPVHLAFGDVRKATEPSSGFPMASMVMDSVVEVDIRCMCALGADPDASTKGYRLPRSLRADPFMHSSRTSRTNCANPGVGPQAQGRVE